MDCRVVPAGSSGVAAGGVPGDAGGPGAGWEAGTVGSPAVLYRIWGSAFPTGLAVFFLRRDVREMARKLSGNFGPGDDARLESFHGAAPGFFQRWLPVQSWVGVMHTAWRRAEGQWGDGKRGNRVRGEGEDSCRPGGRMTPALSAGVQALGGAPGAMEGTLVGPGGGACRVLWGPGD